MVRDDENLSVENVAARSLTPRQVRRLRILVGGLTGVVLGLVLTGGYILAGLLGFLFGMLISFSDLTMVGAALGAGFALSLGFFSRLQSEGTEGLGGFVVMWCVFGALAGWIVRSLGWAFMRVKGRKGEKE